MTVLAKSITWCIRGEFSRWECSKGHRGNTRAGPGRRVAEPGWSWGCPRLVKVYAGRRWAELGGGRESRVEGLEAGVGVWATWSVAEAAKGVFSKTLKAQGAWRLRFPARCQRPPSPPRGAGGTVPRSPLLLALSPGLFLPEKGREKGESVF